MAADFRVERDSMGELEVPATALWGAQTQRAVENFPISGLTDAAARSCARSGSIKWAAADANRSLELLPAAIAKAIQGAALEVAGGKHDAQFPIDVFQTGSGTSSNMNANEVIAKLATQALGQARAPERSRQHEPEQQRRDPDRDPCERRARDRERAAAGARASAARPSSKKAKKVAGIVKTGRTHLMDAMPVTARSGARRLGGADLSNIFRLKGALPRLTGSRRAAPPSAPASTRIRSSARSSRPRSRSARASASTRSTTSSRR